jgi:[ribosomal protein S5]-alanine N-acetyltransferase
MVRAFLDPAVIPGGRVAASVQSVLPAGGGLVRPWLLADARAIAAAYADLVIHRWHARPVDSEDQARDLILRWQRSWRAETGRALGGGPRRGRRGGRPGGTAVDDARRLVGRVPLPAARGCGVAPGRPRRWPCGQGVQRSAALPADGWHDMHFHARVSDDAPPAG